MMAEYHGIVAPAIAFAIAMIISGVLMKSELDSYDEEE